MADTSTRSRERAAFTRSGYPMAALGIALVLGVPLLSAFAGIGGALRLLILVPFLLVGGIVAVLIVGTVSCSNSGSYGGC